MSKYNSYAKEADSTFKEIRAEYNKAYEAYTEAKSKNDTAVTLPNISSNAVYKAECLAKFEKAKADMENAKQSWTTLDKKLAELGAKFAQEVEKEYAANPDEIDSNTLKLLESGILNINDYERLVEKFADNRTMSRLINKYARDKFENDRKRNTYEVNSRYQAVLGATLSDHAIHELKEAWNGLVSSMNTMTGRGFNAEKRIDIGHTYTMINKYDDTMGRMIENF